MIVEDLYISPELFSVLQPILVTSRFMGLFPISYIKCGVQYKLKLSVPYGIYSYLLSILLVSATLAGLIHDLSEDDTHSIRMTDKKTRFVTCCDISIVIFIVIFSTVTLPYKVKKFWKIMHCLNETDQIIPISTPKRFRKSSIYFICTVLMLIILLFSFDISTWFNTMRIKHRNPLTYLKEYLCFYLLYTIMIVKEVFFWHVIFLIKIKISMMNKDLLKMRQKATWAGNLYMERIINKMELDKFSMKLGLGRKNIRSTKVSACSHSNLVHEMMLLTKFEDKIFEAVECINGAMEFGVHIIILSCLLHLIVTPYFLLQEMLKHGSPLFITLQSIWVLGHIGRVLIIVEPCQLCIDEHQKTTNLICDLLTCDFEEDVKKAVSFCRDLDSIAGAVTTYLVILFQFNNN